MWEIKIKSIVGKSSIDNPGGVSLFGPAKLTGEALCVKWGSVRIFKPFYCINNVEYPTHVSVGISRLSFKNFGSFLYSLKFKGSGWVLSHLHLIKSEKDLLIALVCLFWKLPSGRWWLSFESESKISFALEVRQLLSMKSIITKKLI